MADRTPRKKRPITIFSILALIVLVVGGGLTMLLSYAAIDHWMMSGEQFAIGKAGSIEFLTPGEQVVFFESKAQLPGDPDAIEFFMQGQDGTYLEIARVPQDEREDYAPRRFLPRTEVFGRPLWRVTVTDPGLFTFRVDNYHLDQDPDSDRIVFGKIPQSFRAATARTNQLMFALLTITGVLFVTLYVLHAVVLSRRAQAAESSTPTPALQPVD